MNVSNAMLDNISELGDCVLPLTAPSDSILMVLTRMADEYQHYNQVSKWDGGPLAYAIQE